MIVAVAVCPAAPWLIPGVAPRLAERAADIETAAVAAVATLADTDRVVVVLPPRPGTSGSRSPEPETFLPSGEFRVAVTRSDRGAGPMTSIAPAVAAALLARAGVDRPVTVVTATDRSLAPPEGTDDPAVRIGLLVLADGAAAHGPSAPGGQDPRAAGLDRRITAALAAGRPADLAAATRPTADPAPVDLLAWVGGLQLLAAWTMGRPPRQAELLAYAAPFGVGYPVAAWRWSAAPEDGATQDR